MSQAHSQTTECKQMQGVDQGKSINVQGRAEPSLHALVCWWRNRCLASTRNRHHTLTSIMRGQNTVRKQKRKRSRTTALRKDGSLTTSARKCAAKHRKN